MDLLVRQLRAACLLEATARKPGNVHPHARFLDLEYADFVRSAEVAAPWLARAGELGVGPSVLRAVEATQAAVGRNTNLGIALLLAPLAAVPSHAPLSEGIAPVLEGLTVADAVAVYQAIRLAAPGGLGRADDQDVADEPTETLLEVMRRATGHDRIARQYAESYRGVLQTGVDELRFWRSHIERIPPHRSADVDLPAWELMIVGLQLSLLCRWSDSLIARKCGGEVAAEASRRAARVLQCGWPQTRESFDALREFDDWLRADGHRRNPGTTADLIAAILFAAQRDADFDLPEV